MELKLCDRWKDRSFIQFHVSLNKRMSGSHKYLWYDLSWNILVILCSGKDLVDFFGCPQVSNDATHKVLSPLWNTVSPAQFFTWPKMLKMWVFPDSGQHKDRPCISQWKVSSNGHSYTGIILFAALPTGREKTLERSGSH